MTQPNLPPTYVPGPARANVYGGPAPLPFEEMPAANEPLTEEHWIQDQAETNALTDALLENHRQLARATELANNPRSRGDADTVAYLRSEHQRLVNERVGCTASSGQHVPGLIDKIIDVARNSNTTAVMQDLDRRSGNATGHLQQAEDNVASGVVATYAAQRLAQRRGVVYRAHTRRNQEAQRLQGNRPATAQEQADAAHGRRMEGRTLADASNAAVRAQDSATQLQRHAIARRNLGTYDQDLTYIANRLRTDQEAAVIQLESFEAAADMALEDWDLRLQGLDRTVNEHVIRTQLDNIRRVIGGLSRHDQLRAEALAGYTRILFRFESRLINERLGDGVLRTNATFTEDSGIRAYTGNPDRDYVAYGDGTVARPEDTLAGPVMVRRRAAGEEYQPEPLELNINPQMIPNAPVGRVFRQWEASRNPQDTESAHAALIGHLDVQFEAQEQQLDTFNDARAAIIEEQAAIDLVNDLAHNESRPLTNAEQQTILVHNREITQLELARDVAQAQLGIVRGNINRATYWMSFMEAGANRVETVAQRGWRTLGRAALLEVEVQGRPPEVAPIGVVTVYDTELNGVAGPRTWQIRPDGRTRCLDTATMTYVEYDRDGRRIP